MALLSLICACSNQPTVDVSKKEISDRLLEKIGLQKLSTAQKEQQATQPYKVDVSLIAGDNLNAANGRKPLSLVVKIYQLRSADSFEQLTATQTQSVDDTRQALGDTLLNERELVMIPGQQISLQEKIPHEATALGIVALFHSPAPRRWKFAFETAAAAASGITIGIHACAMTISRGTPLRADEWRNDALLARTQCEE